MTLQISITAIVFFLASAQIVSSSERVQTVTICGCQGVATAVQDCATFEVGKCNTHYREFDESKGVFAYITPVFSDPDDQGYTTVTLYPYADKDCTVLNFQPSGANGWEGKCNEECWSETVSKWGAQGCDMSSAPVQSALAMSIPVIVLAIMILF